jgi:hypothetical protein
LQSDDRADPSEIHRCASIVFFLSTQSTRLPESFLQRVFILPIRTQHVALICRYFGGRYVDVFSSAGVLISRLFPQTEDNGLLKYEVIRM